MAAAALSFSDVIFSWAKGDPFTLSLNGFDVGRGELLLVMGPSGCGKSTLLSLICGLVRPSAGSILVSGTDITALSGSACDRFRADHFGIIFQMFNLLPYASLFDNVLLPLSFAPLRRRRARALGPPAAEAGRLLTRLGLPPDLHGRRAANLSVGQQQRVAVARALIGRPDIIVADEPTSALDRNRQTEFLDLLFEEVSAAEATLIMVSHDESLADRFDRTVAFEAIAGPSRSTP